MPKGIFLAISFPVLFLKEKGRIFPDSFGVGGNIEKKDGSYFYRPIHGSVKIASIFLYDVFSNSEGIRENSFPRVLLTFFSPSHFMAREKKLSHKWLGKKSSPKARPRKSIHEIRAAGGLRKVELRWLCRKWHAIFGKAISNRIKKRGAPIEDRCPKGFFSGISDSGEKSLKKRSGPLKNNNKLSSGLPFLIGALNIFDKFRFNRYIKFKCVY